MDIEQKQSEIIDHFIKQASSASSNASTLASLITEATSHPSLFAFSEILSLPNVLQLEATENSVYLDVLRLFAHGTWSDYKIDGNNLVVLVKKFKWLTGNASRLPQLVPDQILKLKQLTVLTMADTHKVLPYDQLMQELDVTNVRELEDFLINECMLSTSENLLVTIQEKIKWADSMGEIDSKHRKDVEERVEEVKKSLFKADIDFRGHEEICPESGGVMDYEEDRIRPKR
ncbi:unnamed protein product [Lupinus luteus]|uniref:PCI domain-containing protein n=1 Tax=Lupinus luteus TaxID=3873 RepID=A0AAV1W5P9_LUPLU